MDQREKLPLSVDLGPSTKRESPHSLVHEKQQVVIVVDRSEFQRGKLQAGLEAADIALPLRIQPSCRPVKALRALQASFETQNFSEGTPNLAGHLDTEFGEYQVTVDVDTEESAEELEWNRRRVLGLG